MSDAKLMMVELTSEEDAQMRALIDAGEERKVEEFLLRKVYNGEGREVNEKPSIRKATQEMALRVFRQELREQILRDVIDGLHYLLHQGENDRATTLCCATANMLDPETHEIDSVQYVLKEIESVRSEKEKASCKGHA